LSFAGEEVELERLKIRPTEPPIFLVSSLDSPESVDRVQINGFNDTECPAAVDNVRFEATAFNCDAKVPCPV